MRYSPTGVGPFGFLSSVCAVGTTSTDISLPPCTQQSFLDLRKSTNTAAVGFAFGPPAGLFAEYLATTSLNSVTVWAWLVDGPSSAPQATNRPGSVSRKLRDAMIAPPWN